MNFYNHNTFLSSRISSGFNCSGLISSALNNDTFLYNTVTRSASSSSKQDLVNVAEPVVENFSESSSDDSTNSNSISYKDVISLENLKKALKRTKSNSAPGLDGDVKANWNEARLEKLHNDLASQEFKPSPTKRVLIPKADGGKRPLGISSQVDKIVQAALLLHLEPIGESIFQDTSMGFRPKRGCHNALKQVKSRWQNVTWIINIDISKYFDTINHNTLIEIMERHCDQATIELIRKLLKAGYVDISNLSNMVERNANGTPQGSLISPILANFYLNELDVFIHEHLLPKWNFGESRKHVSGYQMRKYLTAEQISTLSGIDEQISGTVEQIRALKHRTWINEGNPSRDPKDPNFFRLYYIRYADDFLIGLSGPKAVAEEIKSTVLEFLEQKLKLKVNESKTSINHSGDRGIKFLGYFLRYLPNKLTLDVAKAEQGIKQPKSIAINSVQLRIPVFSLLARFAERGLTKKRYKSDSYRATSARHLTGLEDHLIVNCFSSIIRGVMEYYRPANQYSDLWAVVAILRKSCALTLADKHKLKTAAKAYKKFGSKLKITNNINPKMSTELYYPAELKSTNNFNLGKAWVNQSLLENDPIKGSYKSNTKTSNICQSPGCMETTNLEEHHINELKSLKKKGKGLNPYLKSLIAKKRDTVTLCREHHMKLHASKKTGGKS
jgi:group II intron reverse transcriptase/maturase